MRSYRIRNDLIEKHEENAYSTQILGNFFHTKMTIVDYFPGLLFKEHQSRKHTCGEGVGAVKRIIKRYLNRKLYDTTQITYVTLEDVAEMYRQGEQVRVLENTTNRDITYQTQLQMLFDIEKRYEGPENTDLMRRIIVSPTGRLTGYVKSLEKALNIGHHDLEEKMPEKKTERKAIPDTANTTIETEFGLNQTQAFANEVTTSDVPTTGAIQ